MPLTVSGTIVHDNQSTGITASGSVTVSGNTVYGSTTGILLENGTGAATATGNVVSESSTGIQVGGSDIASKNRVYDNSTYGILAYYSSQVLGNTVYSNGVGIEAEADTDNAGPSLTNNLVYANASDGIVVSYCDGEAIENNTVYERSGNALMVEEDSRSIQLRNNILWVDTASGAAYALYVTDDSQQGFDSDYNDLYATGSGEVGFWQDLPCNALSNWQDATLQDQDSLSADPLFVTPVQTGVPVGYIDPGNDGRQDDFHERSEQGTFSGGSPAPVLGADDLPTYLTSILATYSHQQSPVIDRGDPASSFSNEPSPNGGYVNLGAYGNTSQASESNVPYVLITTPAGGETWPEGQTFSIDWRTEPPSGTDNITIDLLPAGGTTPVFTISLSRLRLPPTREAIPGPFPIPLHRAVTRSRSSTPTRPIRSTPATISNAFQIVAPVHTYYVSTAGSDAANGLTPETQRPRSPAFCKRTISGRATRFSLPPVLTTSRQISCFPPPSPASSSKAPAARTTILDRGNTNNGQYVFELAGATSVTLEELGITGAYDGIFASDTAASTGLTVSDCQVYGNANIDIFLDTSNDNALLTGNTVYDAATGISAAGVGDTVSDNTVYTTTTGITSDFCTSGVTGVTISDNTVHDNSLVGICTAYGGGTENVLVVGNTVYGQTGSQATGIKIAYGGVAQQNAVYDNYYGINFFDYGSGQALDNTVYNNSQAGIICNFGAILQGNTVYSNGVGVQLSGSNDQLSNNLIYANTNQGILVDGVSSEEGGARSPTTRSISRRAMAMPSISKTDPAASPWKTTSSGSRARPSRLRPVRRA